MLEIKTLSEVMNESVESNVKSSFAKLGIKLDKVNLDGKNCLDSNFEYSDIRKVKALIRKLGFIEYEKQPSYVDSYMRYDQYVNGNSRIVVRYPKATKAWAAVAVYENY